MKASGRVILLVDDSEEDHLLVKAALKECGVDNPVETASSVDSAIARLAGGAPPALVFLDLQMPLKDGLQLLSWIRGRKEAWSRLPVVMLTTSHADAEIRRAYDLGANSFLVKSTGYDELCDMLRRACSYWLELNRGVDPGD
jgi:CheY-like chemotaxis protein